MKGHRYCRERRVVAIVGTALILGAGLASPVLPASAARIGGDDYYLIVYTDANGNSASAAAVGAGLTGTAWIELREVAVHPSAPVCTVDTCPVLDDASYGFSPVNSDIFDTTGVLLDEAGHPWTWRDTFRLTEAQYHRAQSFIAHLRLPKYGVGLTDYKAVIDGSYVNFGDTFWNSYWKSQGFSPAYIGTGCGDFVQAVMDMSGLRSSGHPVFLGGGTGDVKPHWIFEGMSKSGGRLDGGVVTANPSALSYSLHLNPPDACDLWSIEEAAVRHAQQLATGLHLRYSDQQAPNQLDLNPNGPGSTVPPYLGGVPAGQANFFCSGFNYPTPGPWDTRYFVVGPGNSLDEFDSTWVYNPKFTDPPWQPAWTGSQSPAPFCSITEPRGASRPGAWAQQAAPVAHDCFVRIRRESVLTNPVVVGQDVRLRVTCVCGGSAQNPVGPFEWTITGWNEDPALSSVVAGYVMDAHQGHPMPLTTAMLHRGDTLNFYFLHAGTYTVRVSISQGASIPETFQVVAPAWHMTADMCTVGINTVYPEPPIHLPALSLGWNNRGPGGHHGCGQRVGADLKFSMEPISDRTRC